MCPGVDSASKNEYQENSWGWRRPVRKGDELTTFIGRKSRKSGALTYRIPRGLFRPVAGKLLFLKRPARDVDYLPPSSAEVKNEWR
jgi:hypothetical protein